MAIPDLSAVKVYLGSSVSLSDAVIASALVAETAAQASRCKVPLVYPEDLAEALKRRVARNLAVRALPLGMQTSFSEGAVISARIGSDPEISRLEAPYRKRTVG